MCSAITSNNWLIYGLVNCRSFNHLMFNARFIVFSHNIYTTLMSHNLQTHINLPAFSIIGNILAALTPKIVLFNFAGTDNCFQLQSEKHVEAQT